MASMLIVFCVLSVITVYCNGILVVQLSEAGAGKMIAQTLENMDFQLFNLTGKSIISTNYINVQNIVANRLEGVAAHVTLMHDGKLTLTVNIRRMTSTVDVRGKLLKFYSINDKPVVEFVNSQLILHMFVGTSGKNTISYVTFCDMSSEGAVVTSQHWVVQIAAVKIVPLLTSGTHLKDKICPHIKEKLLGNVLALIGGTGSKSIGMNGISVSLRVTDRGVTDANMFIVYQDSEKPDENMLDWQKDLVFQPIRGFRMMQIYVDRMMISDIIESSFINSDSEFEKYLNEHFTIRRLQKYFKVLRRHRQNLTNDSRQWSSNTELLPHQTDRGMVILLVQTTLFLNITSECTNYTLQQLLKFRIDIAITVSTVPRDTDVQFYIWRWRERISCITSDIGDVTNIQDLISEFKLYEWFYPSEAMIAALGLSSLIPSGLSLYNTTLTPAQNYLLIQTDLRFPETSIDTVLQQRNGIHPEYDVSNVSMTYTHKTKMCTVAYNSNPDTNIVIEYKYEQENITTVDANETVTMGWSPLNSGHRVTSVFFNVFTIIFGFLWTVE